MLSELERELQAARASAGLTSMHGDGVIVRIADGDRALSIGESAEAVMVHDYDVRDIVAALLSAGAEAITVNGERLVFQTAVYCVGSTVIVGDRRLSPPLEIVAIGASDSLLRVLEQDPELARLRSRAQDRSVMLHFQAAENLECAAATEAPSLTFARAGE